MFTRSDLASLPNIGSTLARELEGIGIHNEEELAELGSVEAALRIARHGRTDCHSMLCALEGAIRGVRWHHIPQKERTNLIRQFDTARERVHR